MLLCYCEGTGSLVNKIDGYQSVSFACERSFFPISMRVFSICDDKLHGAPAHGNNNCLNFSSTPRRSIITRIIIFPLSLPISRRAVFAKRKNHNPLFGINI